MMIPGYTVIFLLLSAVNFFSGLQVGTPEDGGYRDIVIAGSKILAAGSGGRLDYYEAAGSAASFSLSYKNNINSVIALDDLTCAAGDGGMFLISEGGSEFKIISTGTTSNINGMTFFRNLLIAVADKGTILVSSDGTSFGLIQPPVKGDIVSVDANDSFCIAVTDAGEILKSEDGLNWKINDFNKEYQGYYQHSVFKKVIVTDDRIAIAGSHADNSPAVYFSSSGSVWNERTLNYEDERGRYNILESQINDIAFYPVENVFILACDNGQLMVLPSCTKCNELIKVSEKNLNAICLSGNKIVVAGESFLVKDLAL